MKTIWQSKTFWVNALTVVASVLTLLSEDQIIAQYPHVVAFIVATLGLVNIGLRIITWAEIKWLILIAAMLSAPRSVAADGITKESIEAIANVAKSNDDKKPTINAVVGDTQVEPGEQITFSLVLEPGQNCCWEVFPLGQRVDVRRIKDGDTRTSVLNFGTGKPPHGDWQKPWTFTVANYLFVGESPDEPPIVTYKIVQVNHGPRPPPDDVDPPPPTPSPIPGEGLRVMILEETADRATIPRSQLVVLNSTTVRAYLNSKCARSADGKHIEWRQWDDDFTEDDLKNESQLWRDAYARAKKDANGKFPWILIGAGNKGASQELPKTEAETLELLKQYGG